MKYPAYPSYRPNRVGCFEELPDAWTVRRLRFLVHGIDQGWSPQANNMPAEDGEMGVLKLSAVGGGAFYPGENKHLEEVPEGQVILTPKAQDVLMTRANTPSLVGDVCHVSQDYPDLIIPDLIYRIRVDHTQVAPRYLMYTLLSWAGRAQIESLARGSSASMVKLGQGHLKDFQIPLPPREEQDQVVAFLDWRTGQIDSLIAKKKELIEKLKENRTAVTTQVVTKGLNTSAPLHDSGIAWLGYVPEHWEISKAKFVCDRIVDCKNRTPEYFDDGDFYVVRTSDVKDGKVELEYALRTNLENYQEWTLRGAPQARDVLFTREAPAGEAAIFNGESQVCMGQRMMYFRVDSQKLLPEYLLAYIYTKSIRAYIDGESDGSTVTHLRLGQVYDMKFLRPPLKEQIAIISYLEAQLAKIEWMITRAEWVIGKLDEYRTALITDAVTGKIDVRGVQIPVQL